MMALGAQVIVTPTDVPPDSPESYYSVARRIAADTPNAWYPDQYNNPKNIERITIPPDRNLGTNSRAD